MIKQQATTSKTMSGQVRNSKYSHLHGKGGEKQEIQQKVKVLQSKAKATATATSEPMTPNNSIKMHQIVMEEGFKPLSMLNQPFERAWVPNDLRLKMVKSPKSAPIKIVVNEQPVTVGAHDHKAAAKALMEMSGHQGQPQESDSESSWGTCSLGDEKPTSSQLNLPSDQPNTAISQPSIVSSDNSFASNNNGKKILNKIKKVKQMARPLEVYTQHDALPESPTMYATEAMMVERGENNSVISDSATESLQVYSEQRESDYQYDSDSGNSSISSKSSVSTFTEQLSSHPSISDHKSEVSAEMIMEMNEAAYPYGSDSNAWKHVQKERLRELKVNKMIRKSSANATMVQYHPFYKEITQREEEESYRLIEEMAGEFEFEHMTQKQQEARDQKLAMQQQQAEFTMADQKQQQRRQQEEADAN